MLKVTAYPAQGFGANAQVRGNVAQRHTLYYVRRLQQALISFSGCFKLRIYKPFFQPDIIFFVSNPQESFYIIILI